MRIKTDDPKELWKLYAEGTSYKDRINLYNTVETNERFYSGDQWHGLKAPDIDKPVVNIIRQPINYMAATIVGDDVVIDLTPCLPSSEEERYLDGVTSEVERIREQIDMETISRDSVRDAAIDADVCLFHYWDSSVKTGQSQDGDVRAHLIENTNVIFGNPTQRDPQRQPYIQVIMRDYLEDVIDEAVANGMDEETARETIKADDPTYADDTQLFDKLVTKLMTFWRKGKTIQCVISTHHAIIREEWDTGLYLYPIAWFSWQRSRNSYHGVSIVTELVPSQIYINKMVANLLRCNSLYAYPKIVYDGTKIKQWDSRIGANIKVMGKPNDAYAAIFPGTGASADVVNLLDWLLSRVKESSGANDASLGQISSDNTSAIIAAQEANTVPLDLVQRSFYNYQEQSIRIIIDMLRANAGERVIAISDEEKAAQAQLDQLPMTDTYDNGNMEYGAEGMENGGDIESIMGMASQLPKELSSPVVDSADSIGSPTDIANAPADTKVIDFSRLGDMAWNLKVSVGAGSYFSEAIRSTTLGNLVQMGLMDALDYYKRIPDKFVPNKQEIIERLEEQQAYQPEQPMTGNEDEEALAAGEGSPDIGDSMAVKQAKKFIQGLRPSI